MASTLQPADNQELFPMSWVLTEAVQTVVRVAPLGVCLLRAVRLPTLSTSDAPSSGEPIVDFSYQAVNEVLQAMLNLPAEDIVHRTLKFLSRDEHISDLIGRLIHTVVTGQSDQYTRTYQLDGVLRTYHQLYVKSDDGVLMLVQDITYTPLSSQEEAANNRLLQAIENRLAVAHIRSLLLALIGGQIY